VRQWGIRRLGVVLYENSYMNGDAHRIVMKEEQEIDADTAARLASNYFEKGEGLKAKPPEMSLADWMCLTIASVERKRKEFIVKCELFEEPSSNTRSKYRLKISKKGEIKEVKKQTK